MATPRAMDQKTPSNDPSTEKTVAEERFEEVLKTPVRPGKGTKRKYPDNTPASTPSRPDDGGSVKKRRRSSSSGTALSRMGSPATSLLKPPLTERQQMALLLQMTDPSKQQSPGSPAVVVGPATPETTPRRLQRKNERGESPLHLVAIKGDLKGVSTLLRQGANVMATDHAGWTPLHEACNYGHSTIARELLSHGADVGIAGMDGDTPLHDAVGNGHLETVRVLLQHGGNPHRANEKGHTPIDICTHPGIMDLLKSCDQDHSESNSNDDNPCPKRRNSSNHDDNGIADKDEYSAVFSPERPPVTTHTSMTTPTMPIKKTRLRGVSFSDISSSESDLETVIGNKECEKDGPNNKANVALLPEMEAKVETKIETNGKGLQQNSSPPKEIDSDNQLTEMTASSLLEGEGENITPPTTPPGNKIAQEDVPEVREDKGSPPLETPGLISSQSPEAATDEMVLSIPLSIVKVSSSGLRTRESSEDPKDVMSPGLQSVASEPPMDTTDTTKTTQKEAESESFNISLDWNNIKSPPPTTPSLHVTHGPIRMQSEDGSSYIATPNSDHILPIRTSAEQNDTVISYRTSLPLVFSCRTSPLIGGVSRLLSSKSLSGPPSPEGPRAATAHLIHENRLKRSYSQDSVSMPPKMRHRPVVRSAVVQQRKSHTPKTNEHADLPLFIPSHDLQLREPITPISPKVVYPPLPPTLHKQFSEQETERIRLVTTHRVEQERLRLSLIQELCRAQQRAKKGPAPLSACTLILEKLLPLSTPIEPRYLKLETEQRPGEDDIDSRLLSGLVQDVWDKFRELKFSLLCRQRHEAESLWLTQREQWLSAGSEESVGGLVQTDVPHPHVPLVSPSNLTH